MRATPALGELLDLLRAEGFAIGVDDHVRVGRLLALEVAWSEDQLWAAIRSIIAKDAAQRMAFDVVWRRLFSVGGGGGLQEEQEGPLSVGVERPPQPPGMRRLIGGLMAALGMAIIAAIWWQWPSGESVVPDAGVASGSSYPVTDASLDAPVTTEPTPDAAIPADILSPAELRDLVALGLLVAGGALLASGLVIGGVLAMLRRRFIPGPWRYAPQVPVSTRPVLEPDDVTDGVAYLTWQADRAPPKVLDVDRSARATAATGGAPVLLYHRPPVAPWYLVLEDTEPGSECWHFLYDELWKRLAREGVDITRYTFAGNPSWCTSIDGGERRALRDLVEHCDALIVVGNGDAAFDPVEGARAPWLHLLRHVPRRLWLNPVPEAQWSRGAQAIACDTPMEHAIARGLVALQFPGGARKPATGAAALDDHLGPVGMRTVAAIAISGLPSIAALRWLVERFQLPLDEATWLRVVTMPWFSSGIWPEGLQARLVAWLRAADVTFANEVAQAAEAVLVADEPAPGSVAHLRWELALAGVRARKGDGAEARAVIQKIAATALYNEVAEQISGTRWGRMDWWIRLFAVAGIVLCIVGGTRLLISGTVSLPVAQGDLGGGSRSLADATVSIKCRNTTEFAVPCTAFLLKIDGRNRSNILVTTRECAKDQCIEIYFDGDKKSYLTSLSSSTGLAGRLSLLRVANDLDVRPLSIDCSGSEVRVGDQGRLLIASDTMSTIMTEALIAHIDTNKGTFEAIINDPPLVKYRGLPLIRESGDELLVIGVSLDAPARTMKFANTNLLCAWAPR